MEKEDKNVKLLADRQSDDGSREIRGGFSVNCPHLRILLSVVILQSNLPIDNSRNINFICSYVCSVKATPKMTSPIVFFRQKNNLKVAILVNHGCRRYGVEYFADRLIRFYYSTINYFTSF